MSKIWLDDVLKFALKKNIIVSLGLSDDGDYCIYVNDELLIDEMAWEDFQFEINEDDATSMLKQMNEALKEEAKE